jgi:hypothetical protein
LSVPAVDQALMNGHTPFVRPRSGQTGRAGPPNPPSEATTRGPTATDRAQSSWSSRPG